MAIGKVEMKSAAAAVDWSKNAGRQSSEGLYSGIMRPSSPNRQKPNEPTSPELAVRRDLANHFGGKN